MSAQQPIHELSRAGSAASFAAEARPRPHRNGGDGLASGLGWFSVGLGLAEVTAPGFMAKLIGARDSQDNREMLRAAGFREIASGVGILTRDRPAGWVWARVGGDVMDLALLGFGFRPMEDQGRRRAVAAAAVAGVTALDVLCGRQLSRGTANGHFTRVTRVITVNRAPAEVYRFWRSFENLPRFMRHVESVTMTSPRHSHWRVTGPAGTHMEWNAETIEDRTGELIAWRSLPGAEVENTGAVRFRPAPGGRGTELTVHLEYRPPAGALGSAVAFMFGEEPGQQLQDDLRRFKQVLETGEIPRSESSESLLGMLRPAQPGPAKDYEAFARGDR